MRAPLILLSLLLAPTLAGAVQFDFTGYGDVRLIVPPDEKSWLDGGLGKFRYGANDNDAELRWSEIVGEASLRILPGLSATVVGRIEPKQSETLDFTEAYIHYRPVSITPWRMNFRLGAFFPPISLENTEVGWTSPWTLTPSAINSWVGEELRIIGGSAGLEYHYAGGSVSLEGAIFGWNDPAGVVLAFRGWALDDRPTALQDKLRLPDALAEDWHIPTPWTTLIFKEIDGRPGWYANGVWDDRRVGHLQLMRYDNEANLGAYNHQPAWHTAFWSLGYEREIGPFTLLAQGMTGSTAVAPDPADYSVANFDAAYLLLGWQTGEWRFAARIDRFEVGDHRADPYYNEHGRAYTLAANWEPKHWLRLSAEALNIIADRPFREDVGIDDGTTDETQLQLSVRIYY